MFSPNKGGFEPFHGPTPVKNWGHAPQRALVVLQHPHLGGNGAEKALSGLDFPDSPPWELHFGPFSFMGIFWLMSPLCHLLQSEGAAEGGRNHPPLALIISHNQLPGWHGGVCAVWGAEEGGSGCQDTPMAWGWDARGGWFAESI